ncbi:MAG TPA: hypothetical protein VIG48_06540 [Jatrophihabitans sp.]
MTDRPGAADWLTFVLVAGCAFLAALLEVFFLTEFYNGKAIIPVVILGAIAGNLLLPRLGLAALGRAAGAIVPVAIWLVVVLIPAVYNRPEGDLLVLGTHGQQYAYYGLLFGGAIVGFATVITSTTPGRR